MPVTPFAPRSDTLSASFQGASQQVNARWFVRLRWVIYGGAMATIMAALWGLNLDLPMVSLSALVACGAVSNVGFTGWTRHRRLVSPHVVGIILLFDVGLFTCLLWLTGGAHNPFTLLYLNFVVVAAVALHPAWTGGIGTFSVVCFGLLFLVDGPAASHAPGMLHPGHGDFMANHMRGMWVASGMAAGFIGFFVDGQRRLLVDRNAELLAERERVAQAVRLTSLATLAAGAAHELSTPLSTIAVIAAELEATLTKPDQELAREDAALIRTQVRRCHQVLEQLSADAGAHAGEGTSTILPAELADLVLAKQPDSSRVVVRIVETAIALNLPRRMLARAVRSLVDNALRADPTRAPTLTISPMPRGWRIEVQDSGPGMPASVIERAAEPFFTTRSHGMGLGLYLAREVARQLGGDLQLESGAGGGVHATLTIYGEAS